MKTIRTALLSLGLLGASASVAPATAFAADTWNVDSSHTRVGFAVTHMMLTKVRGEFGTFSGTMQTDDSGTITAVQGTVDVASVNTREDKRDAHLRSPDFFNVAEYAKITFQSNEVKKVGEDYEVLGDLTIRGVTRPVTLQLTDVAGPVQDPWGNTKMGALARTTIDRQDFGVSWNDKLDAGGVVVGDEVDIEIEVELAKAK